MSSSRRWYWAAAATLALVATGWGQQRPSNWQVYKLADRLPESACISITFSPQGKVLARHLNAPKVSELDGYQVTSIPAPESARNRVYQSPGGQLWTVVPEGLQEFRDGAWIFHRVPEIAAAARSQVQVIDPIPLHPVRQGLVLFLLPDRLMEFNSENPDQAHTLLMRAAAQTRLAEFSGMIRARDGGLWIAGARGLAKVPGPLRSLQPETEWREFLLPASLPVSHLEAPREDETGGITCIAECATNQQKAVVYFDGQFWSLRSVPPYRIRSAWRGPDRTSWAMTINGLLEWEPDNPEPTENDEISAGQFWDLATEPGGSFWLATSDGLFRYAPPLWRTPAPLRKLSAPVRCLTSDAEGRLWFMSGNRLLSFQNEHLQQYALPGQFPRNFQASGLFWLRNGILLLAARDPDGSAGDQLFRWEPLSTNFLPVRVAARSRPFRALGLLKDGDLCLQFLKTEGAEPSCSLEVFDGRRLEALPDPPPVSVLGQGIYAFFAAQNGDLWLSGELGTACYHDGKWQPFSSRDKSTPESATCFAELADGRIWCAAQDQIWEFDGRNWMVLRRGPDRINDLLRARDGSIWIASNSGLQRVLQGTWIDNGIEEGLPTVAVRELFEDQNRRLWVATARGLSRFHPEADPDPPRTFVQNLSQGGGGVPEGGTINLNFIGQDKWKYTPRERLLYSYRLDDHDWSPFQEASYVSLTDLPAGKHYFQVQAMDRNGNKDPKPAQLEFAVVLPWYKEKRLVLISSAGAVAALFFAALAFNRHRQLVRSYAAVEQKVAERTHQLELASRELLHSQKMNALGTLAAGIAHDFNNILSIIKGSAQIIEDNLDNPDKIRIRTDRIRTVVEQGAGIVKAMLGFSRESGPEPALCSLNEVVNDTLRLLGDRFLREVQVSFQPAPGLPEVLASKDFIQQILLNFIFNAAESMEKNRQVRLATQPVQALPPDLVLAPAAAAQYVAVSVQDSGCGISPENLPRIFEPFFTTKALSSRRGTGLGLSMAYELAKRLGAGLAVESTLNQGSTFSLILPVREASETLNAQDKPARQGTTPTEL